MERRKFLGRVLGGVLVGTAALAGGRCGGGGDGGPTTPMTGQTFASSSSEGHTHSVTIQRDEVTSPPSGGISKSTSSSAGHTHAFAMSQAQLQAVNQGMSVQLSDSVVQGHSHNYTITKWF